jgi:uncharacterized Zn finger protein
MELVTRKAGGLFPTPKEISFECSCPDWAGMCKHVAAALYGVGVRLEEKPELLFELRGVDHAELVGGAAEAVPRLAGGAKRRKVIKGADLSALFGIELDSSTATVATPDADGAGDPTPARAKTAQTRRAKSAKRADSAPASKAPEPHPRGPRRAQRKPAKRNPRP